MVTISCQTVVQAISKEEAITIASERELSGINAFPFTSNDDKKFHFQNDGTPFELTVVEE